MSAPNDMATDAIARAAAEWLIRLRDRAVTAADRARFAQWLQESPVHVREYLAAAETWGILGAASAWPATPQEDLITAARAALAAVAVLNKSPRPREAPATHAFRGRFAHLHTAVLAGAAVGVAAIAGLVVLRMTGSGGSFDNRVISTARGQERTMVLPDGSVVQLNTLTRVVAHFDGRVRRLELMEGEAFFRVAHDPSRPFDVVTPLATVRAVGTAFDVYTHANGTRIAVVEGRVKVARAEVGGTIAGEERIIERTGHGRVESQTGSAVSLGPQEVLELTRAGVEPTATVSDAANATAWLSHRLMFDDERLDVIAAEFNRYNTLQIVLDKSNLATLRISGVFDPDDPEALLKYLERIEGIRIVRSGSTALIERQAQ